MKWLILLLSRLRLTMCRQSVDIPRTKKGTTPTIHVTARGGFWVDPKEIIESERGWELIEKVSRIRVDHGTDPDSSSPDARETMSAASAVPAVLAEGNR